MPLGRVGISTNVKFWSEKWSYFRVKVTVVVGALVMASVLPLGLPLVTSSTTCHQRRVDNIFLTVDYNNKKKKRRKKKKKKKKAEMLCTTDYKQDIISRVLNWLSSTGK